MHDGTSFRARVGCCRRVRVLETAVEVARVLHCGESRSVRGASARAKHDEQICMQICRGRLAPRAGQRIESCAPSDLRCCRVTKGHKSRQERTNTSVLLCSSNGMVPLHDIEHPCPYPPLLPSHPDYNIKNDGTQHLHHHLQLRSHPPLHLLLRHTPLRCTHHQPATGPHRPHPPGNRPIRKLVPWRLSTCAIHHTLHLCCWSGCRTEVPG